MVDVCRITHESEPALALTTRALRLVAITQRGPRIAWLSRRRGRSVVRESDNLLYWAPRKHKRGAWDQLGGHRLWTTRPGADECEETYRPDNKPCTVTIHRDGFTLTAAVDPVMRVERGFSVRASASDRLVVRHFACNVSDLLWSGGLWGVTVTRPGQHGQYLVPLGSEAPWDTSTIVLFDRWGNGRGGRGFRDEQFSLTRDALVLRPARRENKRMLEARPGILAMHDPERDLFFAKQAAYIPSAAYPRGANVALYTGGADNFYVELETMSPFVTLQPGERAEHTETWILRAEQDVPPTAAAVRALFQ